METKSLVQSIRHLASRIEANGVEKSLIDELNKIADEMEAGEQRALIKERLVTYLDIIARMAPGVAAAVEAIRSVKGC